MAGKPTGWNRLMAKLAGEVPATELDVYRRSGGPVFELMEQVEKQRLAGHIAGLNPWSVPPATRIAALCTWNAFVLQTLANDLVEADYAADPRTPGYLPEVTAAQALRFYAGVEGWVSRAAQAQANPAYRLDVPVPAPLPAWHRVRPILPAHLHGLLQGMRAVREHVDAALAFLPGELPADAGRQAQIHHIRQLNAGAQVQARYADERWTEESPAARERAADHARAAIEQFYLLGQLIADPALVPGGPAAAAPNDAPQWKGAPADGIGWSINYAPATFAEPLPEKNPAPAAPPPAPEPQPEPQPEPAPAPDASADAPAQEQPAAAAMTLVTHRDPVTDTVTIEPAIPVQWITRLKHQAGFSIWPALVRSRGKTTVILRVEARGSDGFTGITDGTITVYTDGEETVLFAGADTRVRTYANELYHERTGFRLHSGLLERIVRARQLWFRMETAYASVYTDQEMMLWLWECCHTFYDRVRDQLAEAEVKPGNESLSSAPAESKSGAPAAPVKLVTRTDDFKKLTITETADSVEFTGLLGRQATFQVRPTLVRGKGETVVLRVYARSRGGFTNLTEATLTVFADRNPVEISPWPDKRATSRKLAGKPLYEEHAGFPFPDGLLDRLCRADRLRLRIATSGAAMGLHPDSIARLQELCRGFRSALDNRDRDPRYPQPKRKR